jgi:hypothetical protein
MVALLQVITEEAVGCPEIKRWKLLLWQVYRPDLIQEQCLKMSNCE